MKNGILPGGAVAMLSISLLAFPVPVFSAQVQEEVSYKTDIRPIIHDYCLNCHRPGGNGYQKSGFDMRSYHSLMKGTRFGAVIKPGDSFTSVIIQVVEGRVHSSIKMPFGMNGGLSRDKIELLKRWVNQGARDN